MKNVHVIEDDEHTEGDSDTEERLFLATECINTVESLERKWFVHLRLNN